MKAILLMVASVCLTACATTAVDCAERLQPINKPLQQPPRASQPASVPRADSAGMERVR